MTKNPFLNALIAIAYITAVASMIFYGSALFGDVEHSNIGVIIPMGMLSLFVLSAAMMGYIFLSQPIQLYLDNKKAEAVNIFLKTVGSFACITAFIFIVLIIL